MTTAYRENISFARSGRFLVKTETGSSYVLDMSNQTLTRSDVGEESVELRRDGEAIPVVELIECKVGSPALLFLQIRDDGVQTLRRTSPVVSIEAVG